MAGRPKDVDGGNARPDSTQDWAYPADRMRSMISRNGSQQLAGADVCLSDPVGGSIAAANAVDQVGTADDRNAWADTGL